MDDLPVYILDSFALLAYLSDEPAAVRVEELIENGRTENAKLFLSIINLGEILYIIERRGGVSRAQDALALLRQLPIEVLPADEKNVLAAAHIKANYPLSYADAFVVAAAQQEDAIILSGDPEFHAIEELANIEWLPKSNP